MAANVLRKSTVNLVTAKELRAVDRKRGREEEDDEEQEEEEESGQHSPPSRRVKHTGVIAAGSNVVVQDLEDLPPEEPDPTGMAARELAAEFTEEARITRLTADDSIPEVQLARYVAFKSGQTDLKLYISFQNTTSEEISQLCESEMKRIQDGLLVCSMKIACGYMIDVATTVNLMAKWHAQIKASTEIQKKVGAPAPDQTLKQVFDLAYKGMPEIGKANNALAKLRELDFYSDGDVQQVYRQLDTVVGDMYAALSAMQKASGTKKAFAEIMSTLQEAFAQGIALCGVQEGEARVGDLPAQYCDELGLGLFEPGVNASLAQKLMAANYPDKEAVIEAGKLREAMRAWQKAKSKISDLRTGRTGVDEFFIELARGGRMSEGAMRAALMQIRRAHRGPLMMTTRLRGAVDSAVQAIQNACPAIAREVTAQKLMESETARSSFIDLVSKYDRDTTPMKRYTNPKTEQAWLKQLDQILIWWSLNLASDRGGSLFFVNR